MEREREREREREKERERVRGRPGCFVCREVTRGNAKVDGAGDTNVHFGESCQGRPRLRKLPHKGSQPEWRARGSGGRSNRATRSAKCSTRHPQAKAVMRHVLSYRGPARVILGWRGIGSGCRSSRATGSVKGYTVPLQEKAVTTSKSRDPPRVIPGWHARGSGCRSHRATRGATPARRSPRGYSASLPAKAVTIGKSR